MSLFQCDKCGCLENTNLTPCYYGMAVFEKDDAEIRKVWRSYLEVLGHPPWYPVGSYCSACSPIWYTPDGQDFGVGPVPDNPAIRYERFESRGWHGKFERTYFAKGEYGTDTNGNLARMDMGPMEPLLHEEPVIAPPRWQRYWRIPVVGRDSKADIKKYMDALPALLAKNAQRTFDAHMAYHEEQGCLSKDSTLAAR